MGDHEISDSQAVELLMQIEAGLDNIDQGITVFDQNLELVFANKRLGELLDVPARLLTRGTKFEALIRYNSEHGEYGPGDVEQQVAERVRVAREFRAHTVERVRPNGRVIRVSGAPLAMGGFATIYTDITQQRRYEIELEKRINAQTRDLRRSEERLRLIANEVPAGIAYLDQDEVFQFVNRRFAQSYGQSVDDIVGHKSQEILSPHMHEDSAPYFARAKAGEAVEFDLEFDHEDGRKLEIRVFLRPDIRADKSVRGFYVLSINFTRHKQAAAALSQAQKMEAIGRLSAGISHDFNNLLTIILGNLRPLAEQMEDPHLREEMVAPSLRAAKRGAELTRQLLAVARRQPLDPKVVNLNEAVEEVANLLKPSLPATTQLRLDLPPQKLWAKVDPGALENALLNLALNAQAAIEESTRKEHGLIELRLVADADQHIKIQCRDNGTGMSQEVQKQIFDPFFSTKVHSGGTGLGLSMAQSFAQMSDGDIAVNSAMDLGTEFEICIPDVAAPTQTEAVPEVPQLPHKQGALALLVDDQDEVRAVLRRELVGLGYAVLEAENAAEAMELLDEVNGIELVLSDIAMPGGMSGMELGHHVRDNFGHVGLILMTGHANLVKSDFDQGLNCPILRKPFEHNSLARAILAAEAQVSLARGEQSAI
ncbi:PAS-domain containing protein [Maritalea sp. S77]|uniref:PAS-domain containing protein n=1 Tax=Maritalea sp. S77 TaxID=3415125 RepID=UPI003C7E2308